MCLVKAYANYSRLSCILDSHPCWGEEGRKQGIASYLIICTEARCATFYRMFAFTTAHFRVLESQSASHWFPDEQSSGAAEIVNRSTGIQASFHSVRRLSPAYSKARYPLTPSSCYPSCYYTRHSSSPHSSPDSSSSAEGYAPQSLPPHPHHYPDPQSSDPNQDPSVRMVSSISISTPRISTLTSMSTSSASPLQQ